MKDNFGFIEDREQEMLSSLRYAENGRDAQIVCRYEDLLDRSGQGLRDLMSKDKSRFNVEGVCPSGEDQPVKDPADEGKSRNLSAQIEVGQVRSLFRFLLSFLLKCGMLLIWASDGSLWSMRTPSIEQANT